MPEQGLLDKINQYFFGFNPPTPPPAGGFLQQLGYSARPSVLRETIGPIIGANQTPYGDLGLAQRTAGLPAQLLKLLGGEMNVIGNEFMSGLTGGSRPSAAQPPPAAQPAAGAAAAATPALPPGQPIQQEANLPPPPNQNDLNQKMMAVNADIEASGAGLGAKKAMRARAASMLQKDGFQDPVMLMLWVEGGSKMAEPILQSQTQLEAAGMRGQGGRTAADYAALEEQKARNAFIRQTMLEMISKKPEDLKLTVPEVVKTGFFGGIKGVDYDALRKMVEGLAGKVGTGSISVMATVDGKKQRLSIPEEKWAEFKKMYPDAVKQ